MEGLAATAARQTARLAQQPLSPTVCLLPLLSRLLLLLRPLVLLLLLLLPFGVLYHRAAALPPGLEAVEGAAGRLSTAGWAPAGPAAVAPFGYPAALSWRPRCLSSPAASAGCWWWMMTPPPAACSCACLSVAAAPAWTSWTTA